MTHIAGKVVPWGGSAAEAIAAIARENVTVLSGATSTVLVELLRAEASTDALRSLSAITVYGSALAPRLMLEMHSRFPAVQVATGYGLTETNGSICSASAVERIEQPGTCGPVVPSVDISIRDDSGMDVPKGHSGVIWVRGPMLMRGYLGDRDGSAAVRQGWFCTEDIGCLDSAGYLYLWERRQDELSISGVRISCSRIERFLCEIGMAEDAVVLGGETSQDPAHLVVAIVRHSHGANYESVSACLQRITSLASHQITVLMLNRLPRTASGKPDRIALRRMVHSPHPETPQ